MADCQYNEWQFITVKHFTTAAATAAVFIRFCLDRTQNSIWFPIQHSTTHCSMWRCRYTWNCRPSAIATVFVSVKCIIAYNGWMAHIHSQPFFIFILPWLCFFFFYITFVRGCFTLMALVVIGVRVYWLVKFCIFLLLLLLFLKAS